MKKHQCVTVNFNNYCVTFQCVDALLKLESNTSILVIDNLSTNDSVEALKKRYKDNENVEIISSGENLGFSNACNYGYRYLKKKKIKYDFIHFLNSDVIVLENNMFDKIEKIYEKTDFYLLGPDIITHGKSFSPIGYFREAKDFQSTIKKTRFLAKIYYLIAIVFQNIMGTKLEDKFSEINSKKIRKRINKGEDIVPVLSGCFLTYPVKFFDVYDFVYSDLTFLYNEEQILTYLLMKKGIRGIVFSDEIKVLHAHAASSKGKNKAKAKFILSNLDKMEKMYKEENDK